MVEFMGDAEADVGPGDGVVPVIVSPQNGEPHFVKLELQRIDKSEKALHDK